MVAPADGKVVAITDLDDEEYIDGPAVRIDIFLAVYNVHVNRAPISGKIIHMRHRPGSHIPAFRKDSDRNERVITVIESEIGTLKVTQIAGTLARRRTIPDMLTQ